MEQSISARRVGVLVQGFDRAPAYRGLAEALQIAIGDGRVGYGVRLPSERDLTVELGVSRTTVTRAYDVLRESGYAEARQGAGTFTRLPGGRRRALDRALDRALTPGTDGADAIDLNCAAASAPPGLAAAFAEAAGDLPSYLGGHGYFPAGLPPLQAAVAAHYEARGLPTDPRQIIITPGALSAAAVVARALSGPRTRVLVESPVYPNATLAIRNAGARLVANPLDPTGWDLDAVGATVAAVRPELAYLIPDFQNPTGLVMSAAQREQYAALLARHDVVAIVDEAHQGLALDGQEMPPPFAAFAPDTITLGSASKSFWGGLRLGWIRAPRELVDAITDARLGIDLGAPVFEQLVLTRLLERGAVLPDHVERLRAQREVLLTALAERLPEFGVVRPGGGLAAWCRLPQPRATAVAGEAERRGLVIAPGPVFAVDGGLDRFVRVPWTLPPEVMRSAVDRLTQAWHAVRDGSPGDGTRAPGRVMVA